jgi:hypothetical protein
MKLLPINDSNAPVIKSSIRQHGEARQQRTDALMLNLKRTQEARKSISSSALDELEALVKTTPHSVTKVQEDNDISARVTTLVPTPYVPPRKIPLLKYQSPLVLISPLAAVEAAIIEHVKQVRAMPEGIYVHEYTMPELAQEHQRAKFYPFNGVHFYFSGYRLEIIPVFEDRELPSWMLHAIPFSRDMIYTAIQPVL